ncbi:MAG: hypothetical protein ACXW15_06805 [Acidimicrobiia bacterium]
MTYPPRTGYEAAASAMTDLVGNGGAQSDLSLGAPPVAWCYQQWGQPF